MFSFKDILANNRFFSAAVLTAGVLVSGAASAAPAVVSTSVNVRAGPGAGYARLATLAGWTPVDAGPCRAGWCQVRRGGSSGWVSARYVRFRVSAYSNGYVMGPAPAAPAPVIYGDSGWGPGFGLGLVTGWAAGNWGNGYRGWNRGWPNGWHRGWHGGWRPDWRGGPNAFTGCSRYGCSPRFSPGWRHGGWNPRWGMGPARFGVFNGGGFHLPGLRPDYAGR